MTEGAVLSRASPADGDRRRAGMSRELSKSIGGSKRPPEHGLGPHGEGGSEADTRRPTSTATGTSRGDVPGLSDTQTMPH